MKYDEKGHPIPIIVWTRSEALSAAIQERFKELLERESIDSDSEEDGD